MKKIIPSNNIYISRSKIPKSGRGVFASHDIRKGELIERCPIIEVSENDTSNLNESILNTYFYYFGNKKMQLAVALGFGSIYNHSYNPNASYKIKPKEKIMDLIAIKNIKTDDEIIVDYNGNTKSKNPMWFEVI